MSNALEREGDEKSQDGTFDAWERSTHDDIRQDPSNLLKEPNGIDLSPRTS